MFADPIGRVTGPGGSLLLSSVFSDFTPGHHALAPPLWTLRWRRARLGVETKACKGRGPWGVSGASADFSRHDPKFRRAIHRHFTKPQIHLK
jgi:hypothetical protein